VADVVRALALEIAMELAPDLRPILHVMIGGVMDRATLPLAYLWVVDLPQDRPVVGVEIDAH
jgi:hypothetical protein